MLKINMLRHFVLLNFNRMLREVVRRMHEILEVCKVSFVM